MHYFSLDIKAYSYSTSHLSNDEDLAYMRLLLMYYDTEQPIPRDTKWVCRRLRLDQEIVLSVLREFFTLKDDGWHQARCDDEIAHYRANAEKNKENGKKGGRPKKNPVGCQSDTSGLPVATETKPNDNPSESQLRINNKELEISNQSNTKANKSPARNARYPIQPLLDRGVEHGVATDWLTIRKSKNSAVTDTVLNGIEREASKAGITFAEAIRIAAERSWQSFKSEWLDKPNNRESKNDQRASIIQQLTGNTQRDTHDFFESVATRLD